MSRIDTGSPSRRPKAMPNVYTVLALVATLAAGAAVGFVWYYATHLTGQSNPFFLVS